MKKLTKNNGFTLAELLIVVAIIAVLVAIAIPVFTTQLEKARESTDLANVRSAYAEVMVEVVNGNTEAKLQVSLKQKKQNWQSSDVITIGGISHSVTEGDTDNWIGIPGADGSCEVSYQEGIGIIFRWDGASSSGGSSSSETTEFKNANSLATTMSGGGLWSSATYGTYTGETAMYHYLADVKATLGDDVGLLKIRLGRNEDGSNYVIGMYYTNKDKTTYTFSDGTTTVTGNVSEIDPDSDLYKYSTLSYKGKYASSDYAGWLWR